MCEQYTVEKIMQEKLIFNSNPMNKMPGNKLKKK